jgi:membrane-associated phospholipid phosphatase
VATAKRPLQKQERHMQHRFYQVCRFVRARLSPAGVFGLYLTIGTIVLVGAAWLFGGISEDLIHGDPLILVDALISEGFRSHTNPRFATAMQYVSALASMSAVGILFALMAAISVWKKLWYQLAGLVAAITGGMLLNLALKHLFDRARPGWADPLLALTDPGFPSGHTMMATIIYGFAAVFLIPRISSWPWRFAITTTAILLVLLIALSRMYLGAHYLSDVLAAMAAGTAWLALCLTAVELLRRQRAGHAAP